jgi:hypothetical protein
VEAVTVSVRNPQKGTECAVVVAAAVVVVVVVVVVSFSVKLRSSSRIRDLRRIEILQYFKCAFPLLHNSQYTLRWIIVFITELRHINHARQFC